jgi:hypothetical protein
MISGILQWNFDRRYATKETPQMNWCIGDRCAVLALIVVAPATTSLAQFFDLTSSMISIDTARRRSTEALWVIKFGKPSINVQISTAGSRTER